GPLDVELAEYIVSKIENRESVKNLAGQTSLLNLCKQISSANLLITNDTLALHIGVSHNVQVLCVANGNHYGRFMPYPKAISNKLTCVFPEDVDRLGEKERVDKYLLKSDLDINSISVQKVFDASFAALGFNK
ncbi:MAG: glycosyltransferase family 9 protein, partial [Imperialibacter sp.]